MQVRIIANPISGGGRGPERAQALSTALAARGIAAEIRITTRAGDAGAWSREAGADCVVSVGGDGTLNEVANALAGTEVRIATLPLGTANVVARELRAPTDPERLAALIAAGTTRIIDAGRHGDRLFLLGAGAGLDAAVVELVHKNRGARLSFVSYVRPALDVIFRYGYHPIAVTIDGETVCDDAHYVIVANCAKSAGAFSPTPVACLDDGLFDVCILRQLRLHRIVRLLALTQLPRFEQRRGVMYRRGSEVSLHSTSGARVPLQLDGDPAGELPGTFSIVPRALSIVAP